MKTSKKKLYNLINAFVLLKRTSYNKETKRKAENERRENKRSQSSDKKAITTDSAPDPKYYRNSPNILNQAQTE